MVEDGVVMVAALEENTDSRNTCVCDWILGRAEGVRPWILGPGSILSGPTLHSQHYNSVIPDVSCANPPKASLPSWLPSPGGSVSPLLPWDADR